MPVKCRSLRRRYGAVRSLGHRKKGMGLRFPVPIAAAWLRWKTIIASLLLAVLGASAIVSAAAAQEHNLEISYRGITLIGVPPGSAATYDVPVIGAGEALDNIRSALDLLLGRSPSSAAALEILKRSGRVVIVYDATFPPQDVSSTGADLAAFVPDLLRDSPPPGGQKDFPVVVGRYVVKWKTEELAASLAHELLGHGMQYLRGRLETMDELDSECEAYLYQENVHQDLGIDKHSRVMIGFRRALEWHWCIPFKQYMRTYAPEKMALWETLNPDVPQLLALFQVYLQSTGAR